MREIMRAAAIAILVVIVAIDIKEIISELTSSSGVMQPVVQWIYPHEQELQDGKSYQSNSINDIPSSSDSPDNSAPSSSSLLDSHHHGHHHHHHHQQQSGHVKVTKPSNNNPMFDPALEAVRKKLQAVGYTVATAHQHAHDPQPPSDSLEFNEEEKQQIVTLKQHLTNVMQQWCLPKLVCELHASMSERGSLTEAERGLLTLIRETSLGTMGEVVSRYHFAAHMGQLLSGVEGNGCNNLYPNCPLSGTKVKEMVKKVRIR